MNEYVVVEGTVAAMATFQAAVVSYINQGFTPQGGLVIDGANVYQAVARDVEPVAGIYPIIAVVDGSPGSFTIATDQRSNFNVGFKFQVTGSTGNDGIYTVTGAGPSFGGGNTTIPVVETVPDATVDGNIIGTT